MNYADAIKVLYDLRLFGAKFGLDNTLKLAALLGQPQQRLRFIHVAGTNGKGSTCAMLEGLYRAAGWRVGLFTSPHLVSFTERIQVNRQPIPEAEVTRLVDEVRACFPAFAPDHHPTFFEVVTVMALRYFAEQPCDLVIWETGLGGRLDATNIVTPLASVITNIGFDHQPWLGDTLPQIAAEKAGIIKPGVPVITATAQPEALAVIVETALRNQAPLTHVAAADTRRPPLAGIQLPLLGEHQRLNAAVALATARVLGGAFPLTDAQVRAGLGQVHWPGRLQLAPRPAGRQILLDGAHNAPGAETLRAALQQYFPSAAPTLIMGVLQDKDVGCICQTLAPVAGRVLVVPVSSERTATPAALRAACARAKPGTPVTECAHLAEALQQAAEDAFVVITGSLYLVGEAMELLNLSPVKANGERGLNEWRMTAESGRVGG